MYEYFVYILASKRNGTLYIGVTNDLIRRVTEHKTDLIEGFTKQHKAHTLVYFEQYDDIRQAILREKRLKKWKRS
ncbi:MAG: GIY-YIG nuclease family protein [Candidatus Edwardsbacteria bacterium]|nr:GIY-YIG nuclease family protein [Candidatus Edwardsbacteria bacterium]